MILSQIPFQVNSNSDHSPMRKQKPHIRIIEKFYGKLYNEGETLHEIFFLIRGRVSLFKRNESGQNVRLSVTKRDEFIGLQALGGFTRASHSARANMSARLLVIPIVQLQQIDKYWPAFKQRLMDQLVRQTDLLEIT